MKNRWVPLFMVMAVLALGLASLIEACGGRSSSTDAGTPKDSAITTAGDAATTDAASAIDATVSPDLSSSSHAEKLAAACTSYCVCLAQSDSASDQPACVAGCESDDPTSSYAIGSGVTVLTDACLTCIAQTSCDDLETTCQSSCNF